MYVIYCLNSKTDDHVKLRQMINGKVKIKEYKSFDEANQALLELYEKHDGKLYTIIMEP